MQRQHSFSALFCVATLCMGNTVAAQTSLSVDPDQSTQMPSTTIQQDSGGDQTAGTMTTMPSQNAQSVMTVANGHLDDVRLNADLVLEVPVKINADESVLEVTNEFNVLCGVYAAPSSDYGAMELASARKSFYLGPQGRFDGTVRLGMHIRTLVAMPGAESDQEAREILLGLASNNATYSCQLGAGSGSRTETMSGAMGGAIGSLDRQGSAYKTKVQGTINHSFQ